ncbi:MAG: CocE/NonD family hydrolase, partial [Stellaceae bacterium]
MATVLREAKNGQMALDKDVEIRLSDGAVLRADVYRPVAAGRYPALMTYGPYGKDSHIGQFMGEGWPRLKSRYPEIVADSTGQHMVFERPDPEVWVPHGYCLIQVDCRGAGRSPGKLDVNSPQEFADFKEAIEWAGEQPWSNGKIGLLGISYYAAGQWMAASYRPKHLAAILPWAGTCDFYRDRTRHGGIFCSGFVGRWWQNSVLNNQNGNGQSTLTDFVTGERSTGPEALPPEQLKANRIDYIDNVRAHPLLDPWYRARSADLSKIEVPALVVSNWGALGLHLRGTIEGLVGIASQEKWLKV